MKVDLHTHTAISDGSLGIEDLLILAKNSSLDKIAITDRDCIASAVRGSTIARRMDAFDVIIGCCFSATDPESRRSIDVLCYLPDAPERLEQLCIENTNIHRKAGNIIAKRASEKFPVPVKYIHACAQGANYINEAHIMRALFNCGYTDTLFGELYEKLFTKGSDLYIGIKPAFPDVRKVIDSIHGAGGIAVLTCPGEEDFALCDVLAAEGAIDGVEAYNPYLSEELSEKLVLLAKENDILATGGSCFAGAFSKTANAIGSVLPPEDIYAALTSYKAKKNRKKKK